MNIRQAIPTDREVLLDVWLRSVRATHTFVPEEDIQSIVAHAVVGVEVVVATDWTGMWAFRDITFLRPVQ